MEMEILTEENLIGVKTAPAAVSRSFIPLVRFPQVSLVKAFLSGCARLSSDPYLPFLTLRVATPSGPPRRWFGTSQLNCLAPYLRESFCESGEGQRKGPTSGEVRGTSGEVGGNFRGSPGTFQKLGGA